MVNHDKASGTPQEPSAGAAKSASGAPEPAGDATDAPPDPTTSIAGESDGGGKELDLTGGSPPGEPSPIELREEGPPPDTLPTVKETSPGLETTRAQIARALVALLAVVILFSFLTLWMAQPSGADLRELLTIIFSPLIALVSGAVGFYFGKRSDEQGD